MGNSVSTGSYKAGPAWFIAGALVASTCWYLHSRRAIGYKPESPTPPVGGSAGLRHVVMFRFHKDAPVNSVAKVEAGFKALGAEIDVVKSFEWGTNNSPVPFNKGFSHIFLATLDNANDRDTYLSHPKYKAFFDLLFGEGILDEVKILDYYPQPVDSMRPLDPRVAIITNLEVKPDRVNDFLNVAPIGARITIAENGCQRFDLLHDPSAPNKFSFYEIYADNAAFERHCQTEYFKQWEEFKQSGLVSCNSARAQLLVQS